MFRMAHTLKVSVGSNCTLLWTTFHTPTARLELHVRTSDSRFFSQKVHETPCQSYPTQDVSSAATSGDDCAPAIDEGVDHLNLSICYLDC